MFAVFNFAIFTSAFLLFLIQPMTANMLLAKVGGSPNIWNACTVFFQVSLLIGYFYSYFVSNKLSLKRQVILHCVLLFCALWVIRFRFGTDVISINSPISDTLYSLAKNIFVPFVLLSTTSPLIQRWLSLSELKESKNPYLLYVYSNIGSLLALYAYPLVLERKLTLNTQGNVWHVLFGLFFCTVVIIGAYLSKTFQNQQTETKTISSDKTNPILIFYWIFFAFVPSSLMLGVTNYLSVDIGGLPFLWIFPLSLYLISFIFTFSKFYTKKISEIFKFLYKASFIVVAILFFYYGASSDSHQNILFITENFLFYFIFATYCHGILADKKPTVEKLTLFYLCLAVGGALGGIFNTFIAPHLFLYFTEYPFVIILSLPFIINSLPENKKDFKKAIVNVIIILFIIVVLHRIKNYTDTIPYLNGILFLFSFLFGMFFVFSEKKTFYFLLISSVLFLSVLPKSDANTLFKKRNFFGTVVVKKTTFFPPLASLNLYQGSTLHGRQNVFDVKNELIYSYDPNAYYGAHAAVKTFFDVFKRPYAPQIAWLGLGSGAIICYPDKQAEHDVFEIDQDIVDISKKYRYFRYLEQCAPAANIKVGDARIELSKINKKYDLIVIDVFSSHFIPVHLTTKEAIEIYRSRLKPDGTILFHISSRAFDIEPILTKIAKELNMSFIVRLLPQDRNSPTNKFPQWGVLANSHDNPEIKTLLSMDGWRNGKMTDNTPLWTDDFHNLFSALRFKD